jgi:hypothetical protein
MAARVALAIVLTAFLSACSSVKCDEQSQNRRAGGECGIFSKF